MRVSRTKNLDEMIGVIGKKIGMSQVQVNGIMMPVTVVSAPANRILELQENEGSIKIRLGFGAKRKANKSENGQFGEGQVPVKTHWFDIDEELKLALQDKKDVDVSVFEDEALVKVIGITKGKGFAGTIKRHNFHRGPMTHGHDHHRAPGSIGDMGRPNVHKGKRMAGHMGHTQVTVRKLKVVATDAASGEILIKGAIPGPNGNLVVIEKL